jgi:hypothetical protein
MITHALGLRPAGSFMAPSMQGACDLAEPSWRAGRDACLAPGAMRGRSAPCLASRPVSRNWHVLCAADEQIRVERKADTRPSAARSIPTLFGASAGLALLLGVFDEAGASLTGSNKRPSLLDAVGRSGDADSDHVPVGSRGWREERDERRRRFFKVSHASASLPCSERQLSVTADPRTLAAPCRRAAAEGGRPDIRVGALSRTSVELRLAWDTRTTMTNVRKASARVWHAASMLQAQGARSTAWAHAEQSARRHRVTLRVQGCTNVSTSSLNAPSSARSSRRRISSR